MTVIHTDTDSEQGTSPPRPSPTPAAMDIEQGTAPRRPRGCEICMCVLLGPAFLFAMGLLLWSMVEGVMYKEPHYSVAIAGISGLDPGGRRTPLDLEFNLTVLVAPRSPFIHTCAYPGTTASVNYHGLQLASAAVPKFCETQGTRTVIARGRVWRSWTELDNLAVDVRRAAGVFEVTISIPYTEGAQNERHMLEVSCKGRRVGEAVDGVPFCDMRDVQEATSTY